MTREPTFVLAGPDGALVADGVHTAFSRISDARAALASHSASIVVGASVLLIALVFLSAFVFVSAFVRVRAFVVVSALVLMCGSVLVGALVGVSASVLASCFFLLGTVSTSSSRGNHG